MSSQFSPSRSVLFVLPMLGLIALLWGSSATSSRAQNNNNNNGNGFFRQVGGISVDAKGVVDRTTIEDFKIGQDLRKGLRTKVPGDLSKPSDLRMVSLRGIEAACREAIENKVPLPEELVYLSGMQRVQYVFVYPEQNDIVLAGPGEAWKYDESGNVVGVTTGLPALQLDDLLVAMRTVKAAKGEGISCSIDPTPEGRVNLDRYLKRQKTFSPEVVAGMEKALGPQMITLTGIPPESHFARVLVAADFQMKRLAMHLEPAPIAELPSFLDLMKSKRVKLTNMMPRWWLACNYEPLAKSEDGLSWEIRGPGVKAMTEDDYVAASGEVKGSGKKNPVAQEWAERMTKKYGELSVKSPIFADLRNIMDLCVVAALIHKEDLCGQAGCQLPLIAAPDSLLSSVVWHAPKSVSTQCSFIKSGKEYIITASGGVLVESFDVVQRSEVSQQLPKIRAKAAPTATGKSWYWN